MQSCFPHRLDILCSFRQLKFECSWDFFWGRTFTQPWSMRLFSAIHGGVVLVDDVEGFSSFDLLDGFVGAVPNALAEAYECIFIGHVPCWY